MLRIDLVTRGYSLGKFFLKQLIDNSNGAARTAAVCTPPANDRLKVTLTDVYPGYKVSVYFEFKNDWATTGMVDSIDLSEPPEIKVILGGIYLSQILDTGQKAPGAVRVEVGKIPKSQTNEYSFDIHIGMTRLVDNCGVAA